MALPAEMAMQLDADPIARPRERDVMKMPAIDGRIGDRAKPRPLEGRKTGLPLRRCNDEIEIRKPAFADPAFLDLQKPVRTFEKDEGRAGTPKNSGNRQSLIADRTVLLGIGMVNEAEVVAQILRGAMGPAPSLEGGVKVGDNA